MIRAYLKILKKKNFFLLWSGQVISQFGDRLTQMALIGLVYRFQGASSIGLAKILSLAIIPVFIISPVSGAYVDRWNKRKTLYISDLTRGLLIMSIPLILKFNSIILVYTALFLSFCAGRFFIPAKMAIIPSLVDKDEMFLANSLVSITSMIAAVIGFGLGGVMVEKLGVDAAFRLDAASFFISGAFIFLMNTGNGHHFAAKDLIDMGKDAFRNVKNSLVFEMKEGFRYLLKSKETLYSVKIRIILFASIGSLYTVFIVFMQNTFKSVTGDLGWLAVAAGAGMFFGTLVYGRIGTRLPVKKTINTSLFISGAFLLAFTFILKHYPVKIFAIFSCALLGILCSPIEIALNTIIHNETRNEFLGRIFSSLEIVLHIAFLIFMFIASILAELMTPFTIIASVSIILMAISTINFLKPDD